MGKKSRPKTPDYVGISKQQAAESARLADQQTRANRPNLVTPWGSQTWQEGPNNSWTSQITLSPQQQQALDSQMAVQTGRSDAAQGLLGRAVDAFNQPLDYSGVSRGADRLEAQSRPQAGPLRTEMSATAGDWRQRAQQAALDFQRPLQQQRQSNLESRLANMGVQRGTEAWNREMMNLRDQDMRDQLQAFGAGQSEANMLFNQDLQSSQFANQAQNQDFNQQLAQGQQRFAQELGAGEFNERLRQQDTAEMYAQRGQPLNELNALLTGQQVSNPQMPSFSQAGRAETPQLLNAANMGYQGQLDAYNAQQAQLGGAMGGLFSLGSAAIGNPAGWGGLFKFSDRRLKRDIEHLFTLPNGIKIYKYRMLGNPMLQIGVIAQEVQEIMPKAVRVDKSGYLMINYDMVLA